MKKGLTAIAVVLDKSGSMDAIKGDTIGSFNQFLRDQKALPGEALLSLTLFDTNIEQRHNAVPIQAVPELTVMTYHPGGMTALYDAVGLTIKSLGEVLAATPEDERPEKVIFVIQTDGAENSSKEYTAAQLKALVEHQRDRYQWEFLFLGAGQDAWATGDAFGMRVNQTLSYHPQQQGQAVAYASNYTTALRSGQTPELETNDLRP